MMKQRKPYAGLKPEELEQLAARQLRSAADGLRESANALKEAGDFGTDVREQLDDVSKTASRVKRAAGKKLK